MIALTFLRVLQEAMHNAMKHSSAKSMTIRLTCSDGNLRLEIYDDGVGFDVMLGADLGRLEPNHVCFVSHQYLAFISTT